MRVDHCDDSILFPPPQPVQTLSIDVDLERYQIFSYIASSRKRALGTQEVQGGFSGNINLEDEFRFNDEHYSHSRQLRSNIIRERPCWQEVLEHCFGTGK